MLEDLARDVAPPRVHVAAHAARELLVGDVPVAAEVEVREERLLLLLRELHVKAPIHPP